MATGCPMSTSCRRFGVSRTVVREAIRALSKEGLIEVRHGSGTYVANRTSEALSNSFDLVLAIAGRPKRLAELISRSARSSNRALRRSPRNGRVKKRTLPR